MKKKAQHPIPERTVERLCSYRRTLVRWNLLGKDRFYSHELARETCITAAQVRRDLMSLKTIGTPKHGYVTSNTAEELGLILGGERERKIVLVGVGNLGSSILSYFAGRRPNLRIVAAFDQDPAKVGQTIASCRCLPLSDLEKTVQDEQVLVAIMTVPGSAAQETANALVKAGVRAILNFAPARVKAPEGVHIEDVDISIALEKSVYFGRTLSGELNPRDPVPSASSSNRDRAQGEPMKKILCIDDDRDIIDSYLAILKTAGYDATAAYDGDSGLAQARADKPDLIILDVMMANSTEGFHVAYAIRADEKLQHVPILMLTSVSSEWNMKFDKDKDGAYLPVDAFVDKPIAPNTLLSTVKRLLELSPSQINVAGVER